MTKKIAFFLPHFDIGGVERVVLNLLSHLDRSMFSPSLILSKEQGALLPLLPNDVPVTNFEGAPMRSTIFKLRKLIKKQKIDILYGGTNAANLTAIIACQLLQRKPFLIASEHTPPSLFLDNAKWKPLRTLAMKALYPLTDCIAVPTEQIAQELVAILGSRSTHTVTLPNPIIPSKLLSENNNHIFKKEGPLQLIAAGRLVKLKGFDILLDATKVLLDQGLNAELTILGEGPERSKLEQQIESLGLSAKVTLLGNVNEPINHFKKASIFILSSRREGFGNVIIEAMASGLPVISCDCPVGPRAILKDGKYGILTAMNDPISLASAITNLVSNPKKMKQFQTLGLERAADFTIENAINRFQLAILQPHH